MPGRFIPTSTSTATSITYYRHSTESTRIVKEAVSVKIIKLRTIEEAKKLSLPPIPKEFFAEGRELERRASQGMARHTVLKGIYGLVDKVGELVAPLHCVLRRLFCLLHHSRTGDRA